MSDKPQYKTFRSGDVVVIVMRMEYNGRVYYKRKIEKKYTDKETGKPKSSPWLSYPWDDRDEQLARGRATRWVHKQQQRDRKGRTSRWQDTDDVW